jgi:signal transduction histidine kinase
MQRKIFLGALLVGIVVFGVAVATLVSVRNAVQAREREDLFRQASVTALRVSRQLDEVDFEPGANLAARAREFSSRVQPILNNARDLGGHDIVEAALKVGDQPLVALSENPQLLTEDVTDRDVFSVVADGEAMLATVQRITLVEEPEVALILAIGTTEPLFPVQIFTRTLLLALGAGALVAVALAMLFSWTTGRRLHGLESASASIAAGDLTARAPVKGNDEITEVSLAFNDMAGQLEAARARERDFLMSVGHDLRTPLTTIRGYAEALDAGQVDADDLERVAGVLHTQTDRLSRLIEDFMLLARLEAREFTLRPEPVDLAAHVKEIVDGYLARADSAYVRMELDIEEVGRVTVDPDRVSQICGNLLDNAFRYTPEGGIVGVGLERVEHRVRISVADTGPGIAPEDVPRVFDRLYVAQRYRPLRPEGSGLGLSIVHELVAAMGGEIGVQSTLGRGTVFSVTLPISPPP